MPYNKRQRTRSGAFRRARSVSRPRRRRPVKKVRFVSRKRTKYVGYRKKRMMYKRKRKTSINWKNQLALKPVNPGLIRQRSLVKCIEHYEPISVAVNPNRNQLDNIINGGRHKLCIGIPCNLPCNLTRRYHDQLLKNGLFHHGVIKTKSPVDSFHDESIYPRKLAMYDLLYHKYTCIGSQIVVRIDPIRYVDPKTEKTHRHTEQSWTEGNPQDEYHVGIIFQQAKIKRKSSYRYGFNDPNAQSLTGLGDVNLQSPSEPNLEDKQPFPIGKDLFSLCENGVTQADFKLPETISEWKESRKEKLCRLSGTKATYLRKTWSIQMDRDLTKGNYVSSSKYQTEFPKMKKSENKIVVSNFNDPEKEWMFVIVIYRNKSIFCVKQDRSNVSIVDLTNTGHNLIQNEYYKNCRVNMQITQKWNIVCYEPKNIGKNPIFDVYDDPDDLAIQERFIQNDQNVPNEKAEEDKRTILEMS